jgi:hypothetical protein
MKIAGEYKFVDVYDSIVTIPDCFVLSKNKIGRGNGEAKLYFGSKDSMRSFFGEIGFTAKCFLLKQDLISYMETIRAEYLSPSYCYRGKNDFGFLWEERYKKVLMLDDVIYFYVQDQQQIEGIRGYINSNDEGYYLIRELSLPLVSYISAMRVECPDEKFCFYLKLFVDFEAIALKKNGPLVFNYGKKNGIVREYVEKYDVNNKKIKESRRIGQEKYRNTLLEECPFCPITMINDERLLVASHIKPWAVSNENERIDPKNGFILSPLYDRLFDQGFITFTDEKHVLVSQWLTPKNAQRIGLKNDSYIQLLPMDEERKKYLEYHRKSVFRG